MRVLKAGLARRPRAIGNAEIPDPPEALISPFDIRAGAGRDSVLDGLRAVAVLSVIAGHFVLFRLASTVSSLPAFATRVASSLAVTGVEIFFLISGYVIARLLRAERVENGKLDLRAFYARRVLRIIPPFYVYLTVVSLLTLAGYISTPSTEIAGSAAFLCNTGMPCSWFVGHSWSLAVEEQFYLVWPSIFAALAFPRIVPFLVAVTLGLFAFSFLRGFVPFANNMSFLYIALGALMACSSRLQAWIVVNVSTGRWLAAAFALLVGILLLPDRLMLLGKPMLLTVLVFGTANVPVASSLLKLPAIQLIGKVSYSLYLWQELFVGRLDAYRWAAPPVLLLPVAAYLSWRFVERPGIAAGRAYTRQRRAALARQGQSEDEADGAANHRLINGR